MFPKRLAITSPWTSTEAAELRQFLSTVAGQRFYTKLFFRRPLPTEKSDLAKRAIQSGMLEGYETLLLEINYLTKPESYDKASKTPDTV